MNMRRILYEKRTFSIGIPMIVVFRKHYVKDFMKQNM